MDGIAHLTLNLSFPDLVAEPLVSPYRYRQNVKQNLDYPPGTKHFLELHLDREKQKAAEKRAKPPVTSSLPIAAQTLLKKAAEERDAKKLRLEKVVSKIMPTPVEESNASKKTDEEYLDDDEKSVISSEADKSREKDMEDPDVKPLITEKLNKVTGTPPLVDLVSSDEEENITLSQKQKLLVCILNFLYVWEGVSF